MKHLLEDNELEVMNYCLNNKVLFLVYITTKQMGSPSTK